MPRRRLRRAATYRQLDISFLRIEVALGHTAATIAEQVGCGREAVLAAMRRHGVAWPPPTLSRVERVRALTDRTERRIAAERLVAELDADLADAHRALRADLRP